MEYCAACESGEGVHVAGVHCVRERRRWWRAVKRTWTLGLVEEEVAGRSWDEMLFGGGGQVLGLNGVGTSGRMGTWTPLGGDTSESSQSWNVRFGWRIYFGERERVSEFNEV